MPITEPIALSDYFYRNATPTLFIVYICPLSLLKDFKKPLQLAKAIMYKLRWL